MQSRQAFGVALTEAREAAGIPSQAALARAVGVSQPEVWRWEHGKQLPTLASFARLTLRAGLDPVPLLAALDSHSEDQSP